MYIKLIRRRSYAHLKTMSIIDAFLMQFLVPHNKLVSCCGVMILYWFRLMAFYGRFKGPIPPICNINKGICVTSFNKISQFLHKLLLVRTDSIPDFRLIVLIINICRCIKLYIYLSNMLQEYKNF